MRYVISIIYLNISDFWYPIPQILHSAQARQGEGKQASRLGIVLFYDHMFVIAGANLEPIKVHQVSIPAILTAQTKPATDHTIGTAATACHHARARAAPAIRSPFFDSSSYSLAKAEARL